VRKDSIVARQLRLGTKRSETACCAWHSAPAAPDPAAAARASAWRYRGTRRRLEARAGAGAAGQELNRRVRRRRPSPILGCVPLPEHAACSF